MKKVVCSVALLSLSSLALADNGPGCGWGAQLWKGKTGLVAHTSAGTTNGSSFNPLAGLVSGTSGCENPGVVNNDYEKKVFVAMNLDDLARDAAQGSGEYLSSMAKLMGIDEKYHASFFQMAQANYASIFNAENADYQQVLTSIDALMRSDAVLSQFTVKS